MKAVTKEQVKKYLKYRLGTDKVWAVSALTKIYANQTADEQVVGTTKYDNGIGFTGADADFLTSLAKNYEKWGRLTDKQMKYVYKKMPKYWGQILKISDVDLLEAQAFKYMENGGKL